MKHFVFLFAFVNICFSSLAQAEEPEPGKFYPGVKQPKEINLSDISKQIAIPQSVASLRLWGVAITFPVLVDENGCYVRHLPPKSGHPDMIAEIEKYLPNACFTPATKEGIPLKYWINVPFMIHFQY